jgi:hypothetical protein
MAALVGAFECVKSTLEVSENWSYELPIAYSFAPRVYEGYSNIIRSLEALFYYREESTVNSFDYIDSHDPAVPLSVR